MTQTHHQCHQQSFSSLAQCHSARTSYLLMAYQIVMEGSLLHDSSRAAAYTMPTNDGHIESGDATARQ